MSKLIKAITSDGAIVAYATDSTDIVARAEKIHKTSPVVTAALGRLLTAASLMGSVLKNSETITLRIKGDGEIGALIAASDDHGNVRGYVENPIVEIPLNNYGKLDVSTAVGKNGLLSVIKDLGLKDPYIGQVPLVSGEIAEDITSYFAISEQIPTVCGLGVLVNSDLSVKNAGGYIIQLLPGADEETIDKLEKNINEIESVTKMLSDNLTPVDICKKALKGFELEVLAEYDTGYVCNCSRERVERALLSINRHDLEEMANDDKETIVDCHFCNKKYRFSKKELIELAEKV